MSRVVKGLKWAKALAGRPSRIPVGRPRGAKAEGVRFERLVAGALPQAASGQWWEFEDANGLGWCQTDLVLVGEREALVLECKLTATAEAWEQLERLYAPVVELALGKRPLGVQVCRNLRGKPEGEVVWGLEYALTLARQGRRPVLHWAGATRLWTPKRAA